MDDKKKKTQSKKRQPSKKVKEKQELMYVNKQKISELIAYSQQQLEKGFELFKEQNLEEALQQTQQCFEIRLNLLGKYHSDVFVAQNLISQILVAQKKDNQALIINVHMIKDLKQISNNNVLLSMLIKIDKKLKYQKRKLCNLILQISEKNILQQFKIILIIFSQANCKISLGLTLVKQKKYQEALRYLDDALQYKEKYKAPLLELFEIYILLGEIYQNLDYIAKSLFYYQKCYDIKSEFLKTQDNSDNLSLTLECYKLLENIKYDQAQNNYEKLLELATKIFQENSNKLDQIMNEIKKCQNAKYCLGNL